MGQSPPRGPEIIKSIKPSWKWGSHPTPIPGVVLRGPGCAVGRLSGGGCPAPALKELRPSSTINILSDNPKYQPCTAVAFISAGKMSPSK